MTNPIYRHHQKKCPTCEGAGFKRGKGGGRFLRRFLSCATCQGTGMVMVASPPAAPTTPPDPNQKPTP